MSRDETIAHLQDELSRLSSMAAGAEAQAGACEEYAQVLLAAAEGLLALLPGLAAQQAREVASISEISAKLAAALKADASHWRVHRDAWAALSQWRPGP